MNLWRAMAVLLLLGSTKSFAGNVRGNGGGVVVCRDGQGKILSAEILDFYEARELRHMQHDFGPATSTYMEKVKYVLERRRQVAPVRTIQWGKWADSFESESTRLSNVELELINDSLIQAWPRGCKIEQIVIQHVPKFPEDRRYIVNQDLWLALNEENKAGLILHEVIYREAILYGHEDSVATRYVSSVWSSPGTPTYLVSQSALNDFFKMVKFAFIEWQGTAPTAYDCNYYYEDGIQFYFSLDRENFISGAIYHSYFPSAPISIRIASSQIVLSLKPNLEQSCDIRPAGELNTDGTLRYLYARSGDVVIQNQTLSFSKFTYDSPAEGLSLKTKSSFTKLQGLNGKLYSNNANTESSLKFNTDLKVTACSGCIQE